jgi:hypothetical protein
MALGFSTEASTGGSKFLPVVKFDAKSGDMICINREPGQKPGEWEKTEVEVELPTKVVIDFENLEVGWISFAPTYSAVMVKAGEKFPTQPTPDHKQAVRAKVFFKEHGLREFSPTSKTVLRVIDKLHDEYLSAADKNAGKMPVISINGTKPVKITTPQGELRFKVPDMVISGWTEPPAAFTEAPAPVAEQPKAKAAKTVQADDFEEF